MRFYFLAAIVALAPSIMSVTGSTCQNALQSCKVKSDCCGNLNCVKLLVSEVSTFALDVAYIKSLEYFNFTSAPNFFSALNLFESHKSSSNVVSQGYSLDEKEGYLQHESWLRAEVYT
ncbi:hypothetical protein BDR06DRAFT_996639 [Suillus hirtellus]|nr:hypothetical protein BDR06DRAFT_996639 [Suillus hirtellus]